MTNEIRSLPFFRSLSEPTLAELERRAVVHNYRADDLIFSEGGDCGGMEVVLEGRVKLFRHREGREQIAMIQGAGNALATTPLLDGKPFPLTARAMTPTRTLFLPHEAYEEMFEQNPDFRRMIIADLAARHRNVLALLNSIALQPVIARVANLIVRHAREAGALDNGREFEIPLPQQQLANEVATTREGVARALARLRREGVIEQQGAHIRVLDQVRLLGWSERTSTRSDDEQMLAI